MQERNLRVLEFPKIREMLARHAVTELGREAALALEPSGDFSTVKILQQETEEALSAIAWHGGSPMAYFPDTREFLQLSKVGAVLSMKALLQIGEMLRASRTVRAALVGESEETPLLREMASAIAANRSLEEEIFNAILSEGEMADRASPELYDIRRRIRILNDKVREKLNAILRSPATQKYLQDGIITMRNGRYVVPVRSDSRQFVPGLIHDQSASGSTLFIEPASVVEIGNDLKQWALKERQEIDRILRDFSDRVAPDADLYRNNLKILQKLDMIFARALFARETRSVMPKINSEGRVHLLQARHPLIDPDKVVPSNLWMGGEFTALVVTGPNTGGKTVTLKTVGLLTLMAQAGMQIPAAFGSEVAVFDEVFADIGDEQSIEQSLSTFSSHMTNIVQILENVTDRSLALFDELGAGTDPTEGAALAMSILDYLLKRGVSTLATTHYSELKAFALSTPGVENASVEFDVETLRPTYKLLIGVPGKSNAFEISKKLGLPEFLIRDAQERLTKDQIRFEDVIANAEYHRQIAEKERRLAEEAHLETNRIRQQAEKMQRELENRREAEIKKARDEAKRILQKAQRESEQVIAELKKKSAGNLKEHELNNLRAQLRNAIDQNSDPLQPARAASDEPPRSLKAGDWVLLIHLNARAEVLDANDRKAEATVQAGAMKLKVNYRDARLLPPEKPKKAPKGGGGVSLAPRAVETELDVRGMNLEDALFAVDMFLDGAVLNKLKIVNVIHGKGTGVLRAGVQKHLKRHPSVAEFRLGRYGEGEDGVTVITLK